MMQRVLRDSTTEGAEWFPTKLPKGHDQRNVCARRHEATGYLCTRAPGKHKVHVAHTGAEDSLTALVEWEEE